jgi:carbon storage regulator
MLVIRRRAGETVVIGEHAEVEILEICGNQVKLGIRAPREVLVMRKEVQLTSAENRVASRPVSPAGMESVIHRLRQIAGE